MKFYLIFAGKTSGLTQSQLRELKSLGEVVEISHQGKLSDIEVLKRDKEIKILGLDPDSFNWNLDVDAFDSIPNVRAIVVQARSYDWVHPKEIKKRGILVSNCPGFYVDSVAEYVICMAIEAARKLPLQIKNGWKMNPDVQPILLKDKVAGIVGLGRIGRRIAELAKGIGMEVIYWSRRSRDARFRFVSLKKLFKDASVIIPALSDNKDTRKLLTRDLIAKTKKTAIIVGINRVKALLDEKFIIKRVSQGKLGGYAFEGDDSHKLDAYKGNVWALPPIAWKTQESIQNQFKIWFENMRAIAYNRPQNVVI